MIVKAFRLQLYIKGQAWSYPGRKLELAILVLAWIIAPIGTLSNFIVFAQTPIPAPSIPPQDIIPPLPETPLLPAPTPTPTSPPIIPIPVIPLPNPTNTISPTVTVRAFRFIGNTAFSNEELAQVIAEYTDVPITFQELTKARDKITKVYNDRGYLTTGAFIPILSIEDGVVTIQIVEGRLEEIEVEGTRRLNQNYVRSRLAIASQTPLNLHQLESAIQLLSTDPLIKRINAELAAGNNPGENRLIVKVEEANSFDFELSTNNSRSPSVGSFRRGVGVSEANLLGIGDRISIGYSNTDGSNSWDASYTLPLNPHNGTLSFRYGNTTSRIVEAPFNVLDINSSSQYFDLSLRQPIIRNTTQEFALGLTASRRVSKAVFLENLLGEAIPFPTTGADDSGQTTVSAIRFSQDATWRGSDRVFALVSEFSLGIDAFDATINNNAPDSRFFSWRGQGQYIQRLAFDAFILLRGNAQLADRSLLPIEQFSLGGQGTVRGYRQDVLLADNGVLASAELQLPFIRFPRGKGVLQLIPFIDAGTVWNSGGNRPNPSSLIGTGIGLQWRQGDSFTARIDWGIPLISVDSTERTWQEKGIYFSATLNRF